MRGLAAATAFVLVLVLAAPLVRAQSQAALNPPHSDSGLDTDADLLFNILQVSVSLTVTTAGSFDIFVDLYDNSGVFYITTGYAPASLPLGPATVPVSLPGSAIYSSGFDGPYTADIYVYDDTFNLDDNGIHMTQFYPFTAFQPPGAVFAPPHSDQGIDTDGDLLFNILRVNATIDVAQAGDYDLDAVVRDSFFNFIASTFNQVTLPAGLGQTVPLDFPGWAVRANGVDGPYTVDMDLYETFGPLLDNDIHMTAGYLATDFDTPPASLNPPHSDRGVDTDGDGLFNAIEIGVSVQVDVADDYNVQVNFWDATFTIYLGSNSSFVSLPTGPQPTPVWMSTLNMVVLGIDGPYTVEISLRDASFNLLGQDVYTTGMYTVAQFDPIPVTFAPPHADAGEDRDIPPDGEFNVLRVDVSLSVVDPGTYLLFADLWDPLMTTLIDSEFSFVPLTTPGPQTVPVYFSGVTIRQSGIDGPYVVQMGLLAFPTFVLIDTDTYTTGTAYLATDFQNVVPETLSGTVRDSVTSVGIPFAQVAAIDYRNMVMTTTTADNAGAYSLGVHQGSWVVLFDDFAYDAALTSVTVSAPTTLNYDLMPVTPNLAIGNATLGPWSDLNLVFTGFLETDVVFLRWQLDWLLGNRDQTLQQAEWDAFLLLGAFPGPTPLNSTWDVFLVDSRWYEFLPGSDWFAFFDAPAPIASTLPIRLETHAAYTNGTIMPAPAHTLRLNVTYDTMTEDFRFNVILPPGYVLTSVTGAPGVTITGIGTGTAVVEPGPDPNPFDLIDSVWIQLDVNTPDATNPIVSSALATPNPVVTGNQLTITAVASDNTAVADVRLQVWNPSGGLSVNVSMADMGGGDYEYGAMFPNVVGDWTFTVTATDFAGNTGSRSGTFRVIELNPPTISATSATPSPQEYGQAVLIAATVTDDTALSTVTVEVRDVGGALVGNFTMVYNAISGDYEYSDTFLEFGANTYAVWATDTSDNVASASGTFTIVDTTDPVLTSPAAAPNPVEVGSAVRISVTATDLAGFTFVRVEVRDPSAAVVDTFNMIAVGGGVYQYDFTPTELGNYAFTITATDVGGNTATAFGAFTSRDTTDPVANAGVDQTVSVGVVVTFNGSVSTDNDAVATYTWTFTDGGQTRTLTGSAATYTFATAGVYVVTLRVEDASGNFHEDTVTITVQAAGGAPGYLGWLAAIVLVIVVVLIVLAIWFMKRKKTALAGAPDAAPPTDLPMPPPPEGPLPPPPE